MRNRTIVLRSAALALGIFVLFVSWGLSSPPGSTPDDDYHTISILCAQGENDFCQNLQLGTPTAAPQATVPLRAAINCFYTSFPSEDGSCIYEQEGLKIDSTRINSGKVTNFYYSVMNRFLGSDYESSIRNMRIFNAFIFVALLFLALTTVIPRVKRGILLFSLTALIPFGAFFVPSVNPTSWAITGVLFSWIFLYSLVSSLRTPLNWTRILLNSLGLLLSLGVALGARKDVQIYLVAIFVATIILTWPRFNVVFRWLLVAAAALLGVLVVNYQPSKIIGFGDTISYVFFNPGLFLQTLAELPAVIAGTIGSSAPIFRNLNFLYYGIGWHEVQMPASAILITLSTLAGLVFSLLPGMRKRNLAAVGFIIFVVIAIQIYGVAAATIGGYNPIVTPRYMAPLVLTAVVMFFTLVKTRRTFPSRGQAVWLLLALPLASAIALLTTIRRYTNGQAETWFTLFFEPNWWWEDFPLGPTAVWFLGVAASLVVSYSAVRLLNGPRTQNRKSTWRDYTPRIVFALSWIFSLVSAWSLLRLPDHLNPATNIFRGYFPGDQLSYAGISASAKAGQFGLVEPFTQTGVSFYPSWWYKIIGQFAAWFGFEIPAAWSFLGFAVVLGSVAFIGIAAWRITGRAWAPLVVGVMLWVGPLSAVLFDNWYVNLVSHAVLWGPYAALYPLNAEAAGLSIGMAAFALGYWTLQRPHWTQRKRLILFILAGLGIGVTANFQTYSFLTLTAVTFWILGIAGVLRSRSRRLLLITVISLGVILVLGSLIRGSVGALPVYALMLVPTIPGLFAFAKDRVLLLASGIGAFLIAAAPQILWMISGTLAQDPFLTYRVDQSGALGVPFWAFLLLGSPILVTWAVILWAQILRKGTTEISLLVGWFIAFVVLSFNNIWGFGQEPYRFWIDSVIIFVAIAAFTLPSGLTTIINSGVRLRIVAALAVVLVGASLWNVGGFRDYVSAQEDIDFNSERLNAIQELVSAQVLVPGLVTAEPCIDPRVLKVATGVPVAFYNLGLAWPENKNEIDAVIDSGNAGVLDIQKMRDAGVSYLITDTGCPTRWYAGGGMGTAQLSSVEYSTDQGEQRLELWRIL